MGKVFSIIANESLLKINSNVLTLILAVYLEIFCGILENFWYFVVLERFCIAIAKLYLVTFV